MKKLSLLGYFLFLIAALCLSGDLFSQNVGIGTTTPKGKLHIKGSADTSQLVIDANSTQSNIRPLIKLRNSAGVDLMWIHSDDTSNIFIGWKQLQKKLVLNSAEWMHRKMNMIYTACAMQSL